MLAESAVGETPWLLGSWVAAGITQIPAVLVVWPPRHSCSRKTPLEPQHRLATICGVVSTFVD